MSSAGLSRHAVGRIEVVTAAAGYGFLGVFGKQAYAAGLGPGEFLTMRFAVAAAILWVYVLIARREILFWERKRVLMCAALGVFGYALFTSLYFRALKDLSASLTSLLLYTFPVIVTVAARLLFKEPIGWKRGVALPVVAAGLVMLLWGDMAVRNWGAVVLALGSAVFYATYILASSRWLRGVDSMAAGLYIMTAATIALFLVAHPSMEQVRGLGTSAWMAVGGIAVISTLGPLVLFLKGLDKLSSPEASILSLVEPMMAVLSAAVLLGERLSLVQLVGGGVILAAMVLSTGRPATTNDA
ncbi:MAG TPA: DMT family transporter [Blastocatellia bacterium]|nr:DMT family transporter [Blastocatellia bacterium]